MAILCLVRHGESEANFNKLYSGTYDHSLTFNGVNQAEKCGAKLAKFSFDVIYSSLLSRTIATTQLVMDQNLVGCNDWRRTALLNERNYGIAENKNKEELLNLFREDVLDTWHQKINSAPPGGETIFSTYKRCVDFYNNELISQISEKNILIVAHAGVIKCLMAVIEDNGVNSTIGMTIKNAEPIVYEF